MMDEKDRLFLDDYFARYRSALANGDVSSELLAFRDLCRRVRATGNKLIFAGNGASASISSHAATDFTQHAGVRSVCFNDHNLITAFANDFGYENWVTRALELYADPDDGIVLISSSGKSANIVNAAEHAVGRGLQVVTFSGFSPDNPLRSKGMANYWVDSRAYNVVETVHLIWIMSVAHMLEQDAGGEDFLADHLARHRRAILGDGDRSGLVAFRDLCRDISDGGGKLVFAGNGGSASIASHAASDLTNQGRVRSVCFNDHNLISAFANDYGQEHWMARCVEFYADARDAVMLISSSGKSANVINAANQACRMGLPVVTFTGYDPANPLRALGRENFWVDSRNYGVVEAAHAAWILCVVDMLVGKAEYGARKVS